MKSGKRGANRRLGQSIIEVLVGCIFLIPMALAGLDVIVLVLANSANDSLVKNAARAAANQTTRNGALIAAQRCVDAFHTSNIIVGVEMAQNVDYQQDKNVSVKTVMTVKMPVGIAGFEIIKFQAQATEPVVAMPADV